MQKIMGAEMHEIASSHLESIGYNYDNGKMIIKTRDRESKSGAITPGSVIEYTDVPMYVYDQMMESDSKGKFMNSEIKGKYEYKTYNNLIPAAETEDE